MSSGCHKRPTAVVDEIGQHVMLVVVVQVPGQVRKGGSLELYTERACEVRSETPQL